MTIYEAGAGRDALAEQREVALSRTLAGIFAALGVCAVVAAGDRPAPGAAAPSEASAAAEADPGASLGMSATKPQSGVYVETPQGYMVPYAQPIPGMDVAIEMVPVPGGQFLLGSPADEADRNADEGPQVRVSVRPFWIGKYEITWGQYKPFMRLYSSFKQLEQLRWQAEAAAGQPESPLAAVLASKPQLAQHLKRKPDFVDGVTCPTPLYEPDATYESGDDPQQPAVTMTPYSARQYTKWLSAITGTHFRLPGESEWEYAARAGTNGAYFFGGDPDKLAEYAWYSENSDDRSRLVGQKKPNPWGLYDIAGNVAELVLDEYAPDAYGVLPTDDPLDAHTAIRWPTRQHPRVARGGSWLDEPAALRSAARTPTDDIEWKLSDPNLPLSPWWFTELYPAGGVGFRILRPMEPMSPEQQRRAWEVDDDGIQFDVDARLDEGRGALETVGPQLPKVLEQLHSREVQKFLE